MLDLQISLSLNLSVLHFGLFQRYFSVSQAGNRVVISKFGQCARIHDVVDLGDVRLLLCYGADDFAFSFRQFFSIQLQNVIGVAWLATV